MSIFLQCSSIYISVLLYSFMICLLGLEDSYTIKCGSPSPLKKKKHSTNESTVLGNYLIYMLQSWIQGCIFVELLTDQRSLSRVSLGTMGFEDRTR